MLIYLLQVAHGPVEKARESFQCCLFPDTFYTAQSKGLGLFDDLVKFLCLVISKVFFFVCQLAVICKRIIVKKVQLNCDPNTNIG